MTEDKITEDKIDEYFKNLVDDLYADPIARKDGSEWEEGQAQEILDNIRARKQRRQHKRNYDRAMKGIFLGTLDK